MCKQFTVALAFLTFCGVAARGADETTKVEAYFAVEHVPEGLKAGARVDLMMVVGKTTTATGIVRYSTNGVAKDVEVVSITEIRNPKTAEQAVKVELKATEDQAAKIKRVQARFVNVTVATSDGQTRSERKPIPLRLEPTKTEKK